MKKPIEPKMPKQGSGKSKLTNPEFKRQIKKWKLDMKKYRDGMKKYEAAEDNDPSSKPKSPTLINVLGKKEAKTALYGQTDAQEKKMDAARKKYKKDMAVWENTKDEDYNKDPTMKASESNNKPSSSKSTPTTASRMSPSSSPPIQPNMPDQPAPEGRTVTKLGKETEPKRFSEEAGRRAIKKVLGDDTLVEYEDMSEAANFKKGGSVKKTEKSRYGMRSGGFTKRGGIYKKGAA